LKQLVVRAWHSKVRPLPKTQTNGISLCLDLNVLVPFLIW